MTDGFADAGRTLDGAVDTAEDMYQLAREESLSKFADDMNTIAPVAPKNTNSSRRLETHTRAPGLAAAAVTRIARLAAEEQDDTRWLGRGFAGL